MTDKTNGVECIFIGDEKDRKGLNYIGYIEYKKDGKMTDEEIFEKYYARYGYPDDWKTKYVSVIIKSTFSYKLFKLQIAIDELKQSIKDALYFWRKG